jgi:hypothetical protein
MGQLVCEVTGCRPERKCQSARTEGSRGRTFKASRPESPSCARDDGMGPTVNSFPEFTFSE